MKASIKKVSDKFEPFTLKIKFESADEARIFWHRLNTCIATLQEEASPLVSFPNDISRDVSKAWKVLDAHMQSIGLRKYQLPAVVSKADATDAISLICVAT